MKESQALVKVTPETENRYPSRPGRSAGPVVFQGEWFGGIRRRYDRRRMNRELAQLFNRARDFQTNGLEAGAPQYGILFRQSCDRLHAFSKRWNVPLEQLAVEFPALHNLERLAHPRRDLGLVGKLLLVAAVLLALAAAAGAILGVGGGVYQFILRWFRG